MFGIESLNLGVYAEYIFLYENVPLYCSSEGW